MISLVKTTFSLLAKLAFCKAPSRCTDKSPFNNVIFLLRNTHYFEIQDKIRSVNQLWCSQILHCSEFTPDDGSLRYIEANA